MICLPSRLLAPVFAVLLAITLPGMATAQVADPPTDVASYDIAVTLDAATKQITGTERITYRNPSQDTLNEVWLRRYLNAFESPDTRWMREAAQGFRGDAYDPDHPGWTRLDSVTLADTGQVLPTEDGADDTVTRVALPRPLAPGESLTLEIAWTAQFPQVFARTGFWGDFVMAGQWYPKLAVYDRGAWDSEPWHGNAEFFADFGSYSLTLTVPEQYATGASGVRQSERRNGDGTKTVEYRAERVTDVAWMAAPDYQVVQRPVQAAGQTVDVELFLPPGDTSGPDPHFAAATAALDSFGRWYGAYPWPKLTLVVPPPGGSGAGGMEYPSLVTTGSDADLPLGLGPGLQMLQTVTIHEIAHQWFPMQVQTNEGTEAWLDEGFAEYLTARVMGRLHGDERSLLNLPFAYLGVEESHRLTMVGASARQPLATAAWQFPSFTSYGATVYSKGGLALGSLEGYFGDERFTAAMRSYADRWRWQHPRSADFQKAVENATGERLDWFFQSFVFGSKVVDYRLAELEGDRAVVERVGDAPFPVQVRTIYADGTTRQVQWDGQQEQFEIAGGPPLSEVQIDPDQRIALEPNRLDNTRVADPGPVPALSLASRVLFMVQAFLQAMGQIG